MNPRRHGEDMQTPHSDIRDFKMGLQHHYAATGRWGFGEVPEAVVDGVDRVVDTTANDAVSRSELSWYRGKVHLSSAESLIHIRLP